MKEILGYTQMPFFLFYKKARFLRKKRNGGNDKIAESEILLFLSDSK